MATVRRAFDAAWRARHPWHAGELAWWLHRSGGTPPVAPWYAEPYRLMLQRNWREAAKEWARLGCPFEEAEALCASGDARAAQRALQLYDELEARVAADRLRRQLAGERPSTVGHHDLTRRQLEVLRHLTTGVSNADIAAALGISVRTVDHHVAAVLMKLSVNSRRDAKAAADRMGIVIGNSLISQAN
jgi:DNA-binding CsgD family transcriptional regulator